jgi:hypothetical protein
MDLFCSYLAHLHGRAALRYTFNLRDFVEYSVYTSEGSVDFHKIPLDSDMGREMEQMATE